MRAAATLLRNQFSRVHVEAAPLDRYCERSVPTCRFMQYSRANDQKRLAMVSTDGTKMIQLSKVSCASDDMMQFIEQRYCMESLMDGVKYMDVDDIDQNIVLLPPITSPNKIIGVECNYVDNCDEKHEPKPKEPKFFVKFSTSIIGALDNIRTHKITKCIDYGCELAVVISKVCRQVPRNMAMDCVFGYMIAQDITARDWRALLGGQMMLGKSLDTFCPLGPVLVHKSHINNVNDLWIKTFVNGQERQTGNTQNMIFKIDYLIHCLSQFVTLCPGDIILTGTPAGAGAYSNPSAYLKPGDLIESEIQHLGKMQNKVVNPYG